MSHASDNSKGSGQVQDGDSIRKNTKIWHDLLCLGLLFLVWLIVWLPRLKGPIDLRWDASAYYVLGTALAEGKGYRLLNEPGEIHAVQYPPLLPLMVAVHHRLMGDSDYFKVSSRLRLFYFTLSGLYLITIYAVARKLLRPLYALLVAGITALSFYSFLHPSDTLYAEVPFGLASMLFLLCRRRDDRPVCAIASGLLATAAYMLRTAGLALLAAWVLETLFQRRYMQAAIRVAVAAVSILAWETYISRAVGSEEYHQPTYSYQRARYYYSNVTYGENSKLIDPFRPELGSTALGDVVGRIGHNLTAIPFSLGESALVPVNAGPTFLNELHKKLGVRLPGNWRMLATHVLSVFLIAAGLLALVGAAVVIRKREWFFALYFVVTVGLITLTPWQSQFWRYLAPLTPLTLLFLMVTLLTIRRWLARSAHWGRIPCAGVTGLPVLGILFIQIDFAANLIRNMQPVSYYDAGGHEHRLKLLTYGSDWHSLDPAFEWVRVNAARHTVVATAVPQLAYVRTQHKAVLPPFELDPLVATRLLDEVPVSYLILDRLGVPGISERYAAPVVASAPENWRLVFTAPDGGTRIYERVR